MINLKIINSYKIYQKLNAQLCIKFIFQLCTSHLQVVELTDALAVNSTSVRLDWQLHVSNTEEYIEVNFQKAKNNNEFIIASYY